MLWLAAAYFGVPVPNRWGLTLDLLTSIDLWIINHAAYPSLFAAAVGATTGTIILPALVSLLLDHPVKPDISIADAFNYIVNDSTAELKPPAQKFGKSRLGKWPGSGHNAAWSEVSSRLTSGDLAIWGIRDRIPSGSATLPSPDSVMRAIPKAYWERPLLRRPACFKNDLQQWQTDSPPNSSDYRYTNLHVSGRQTRSYWPPASWWRRRLADWRGEMRRDYWAMPIDKKYRRVEEGDRDH